MSGLFNRAMSARFVNGGGGGGPAVLPRAGCGGASAAHAVAAFAAGAWSAGGAFVIGTIVFGLGCPEAAAIAEGLA